MNQALTRPIRVSLADDHPFVLMGIKALIELEPRLEVASASPDGAQALEEILAGDADVAVVDLSMPKLDGVQLIARLKRERPALKLLALTVHEDQAYLHQVLRCGADGYLLKRSAAEELVRAILTLWDGQRFIDPAIADKAMDPQPDSPPPSALLSDREMDVLRLLAQGFTSKEIAEKLDIGVKTVDTYKSRAVEKLGLRSRAQIVRFAVGQGWLADI
jgi:DNA-binding NarL/FixJ family response regulator